MGINLFSSATEKQEIEAPAVEATEEAAPVEVAAPPAESVVESGAGQSYRDE
ncbi:MAG TPA: hypothetical protein VMW80_02895 [Candidatus Dormibacteraeota bacterium]|nr:hypothetical protein [Candidatus Dormibacteraeota bacterium]